MRLVWFEMTGYKRFAELAKINVNEKLVAIVGPNEAGKTSLLKCLLHFNHRDPFVAKGGSQEISRGVEIADSDTVAEWTFALDDGDRAAIAHVPEAKSVRWYGIAKRKSGKTYFSLAPWPKRSRELRDKSVREIVERLKQTEQTDDVDLVDDEPADQSELICCFRKLSSALENDESDLPKATVEAIRETIDLIEDEADSLRVLLEDLHAYESGDSPTDQVGALLSKRQPKFLFFSAEDRNLKSEYDLDGYFREEDRKKNILREKIPVALKNLAHATELDLKSLYDAQKNDDRGKVRTLLERAQGRITDSLHQSWTQSKLSISLELDGYRFQILLRSEEGEYVKVVERSDGLRQFVALLLFLARQPTSVCKPILLIDEAESRLHYDAQADLVQVLARQDLASKVIYTTHSIGCLPENLGSGIRMIAAEDPYSKVENHFWDSSRPGFSPLLFSMGAQTLAFLPMRYAVIAEGAADLILVPELLKAGLNVEHLGFQVVPGLSSATGAEIAILDKESSRTAYLTDGDKAGRKMRGKIADAGVSPSMMLSLPVIEGEETVIEDYVPATSYVAAINEELTRSGCTKTITEKDVARPNRPRNLEQWCKAHDLGIPSKRAVAYHIVESQYERPVLDQEAIPQIRSLHDAIATALALNTEV
ncbi:AAA family ATPase [Allorhodopirellula solitaria]|uniref:AAA+ ATPase domain-containing protein n=1 Tax=Allorhodopirellula solitaria TaxID=2527987 RepID=A0A5C5X0C2_9BACT|nr:AAA family ATPase [Allorhodopirellula solitaria]TWT56437.1 hypothetical protein CA85_42500 [Allorhodopirellula solitaria]